MRRFTKFLLIISIFGISLLLFISNSISPSLKEIKKLSYEDLNKKVRVAGEIIRIEQKDKTTVLTINDSSSIRVISLSKIAPPIHQEVEVIGTLEEYFGNFQIFADKIILKK